MTAVYRIILAGLIAGIIALAGCGGGGGGTNVAGIGGTGRTISGTITGFGSIFVNGVEYDIDNASISINDDSNPGLNQSDLRIGMVVTLIANDDGTVGTASQVAYDNEIKGPVSGLVFTGGTTKSFTIFGLSVVADVASTTFDNSSAPGFDFAALADGDVVEVSGLFTSSNTLIATYIEKTDDLDPGNSEVELKGAPNTGTDAGVGENFILNGVTVNILAGTDLSDVPGNRVTGTQFIEVKGTLVSTSPGYSVDAIRIKQEDEGISPEDGEASIEGFVSDFVDNSNFKVSGQQVNATGATFVPAGLVLSNDMLVEVEGTIVNGTLNAVKVEQGD